MSNANMTNQELSDAELEQVKGGLLLPAVQKVREAANSTTQARGHKQWTDLTSFSS